MTDSDLYACDDYILPELSPFDGTFGETSSGSLSAKDANSPSLCKFAFDLLRFSFYCSFGIVSSLVFRTFFETVTSKVTYIRASTHLPLSVDVTYNHKSLLYSLCLPPTH